MDKRELYDNFENIEEMSRQMQVRLTDVKAEMTRIIEKNAELEIENQHLRELLRELEQKKHKEEAGIEAGLSKSRKNLEKLYEEGFHVCNVDNMYGSRRINDEPCVFCQDVIYGERN
ncbi:DNA replication initiation control protein YabA [Ligilactobacillus faecis]|uniref:Replication initiation control protein YabA n=1 Tax=Ligilactobacillus faecis TaxID=762833 RepID=A0ABV4DMQ4_9LACO|nr:DNA replication initiation control protein YabA [Ligilactobacillus faecis]WGN88832.1 DNA replication initiation control protein YabA [Ligilactobacillus faecis]